MPSRFLAASLSLVSFGCVTYDFEPVEPFAVEQTTVPVTVSFRTDKPDLFLVVDKSGSMNFGVDAPGCSCPNGGCPANCPTRWTELKAAMGPFLTSQGSNAHFGMVPFPPVDSAVCGGAVVSDIANYGVEVDRSADSNVTAMQASADAVMAKINGITVPVGGTPTGATMGALVNYSKMVDDKSGRPHYALLLTDGLPNCNNANNASTCTCTSSASPCSAAGNNLCLDDDPTAAEIAKLNNAGVKTIVLGFGTETNSGLGPATLQKLALAGGFQHRCANDSDCGAGDTCSIATTGTICGVPVRTCNRGYFQAGNTAELATALDIIRNSLAVCDPCTYTLDTRPSNPAFLAVRMNGQSLPRNTADGWSYDEAANRIDIKGASCDQLRASTTSSPVKLEFRIVRSF